MQTSEFDIRMRAYLKYIENPLKYVSDIANWLEAENELLLTGNTSPLIFLSCGGWKMCNSDYSIDPNCSEATFTRDDLDKINTGYCMWFDFLVKKTANISEIKVKILNGPKAGNFYSAKYEGDYYGMNKYGIDIHSLLYRNSNSGPPYDNINFQLFVNGLAYKTYSYNLIDETAENTKFYFKKHSNNYRTHYCELFFSYFGNCKNGSSQAFIGHRLGHYFYQEVPSDFLEHTFFDGYWNVKSGQTKRVFDNEPMINDRDWFNVKIIRSCPDERLYECNEKRDITEACLLMVEEDSIRIPYINEIIDNIDLNKIIDISDLGVEDPSSYIKDIARKICEGLYFVVDNTLKPAVLKDRLVPKLNDFYGEENVNVLYGSEVTYENIKEKLVKLTKSESVIDIFSIGHGSSITKSLYNEKSLFASKKIGDNNKELKIPGGSAIENEGKRGNDYVNKKMNDGNGWIKLLPIDVLKETACLPKLRMVYLTECYSSGHINDWFEAGACVAFGFKDVNLPFFIEEALEFWKNGWPPENIKSLERTRSGLLNLPSPKDFIEDTVNTIKNCVEGVVETVVTEVSEAAYVIYQEVNDLFKNISEKVRDEIARQIHSSIKSLFRENCLYHKCHECTRFKIPAEIKFENVITVLPENSFCEKTVK